MPEVIDALTERGGVLGPGHYLGAGLVPRPPVGDGREASAVDSGAEDAVDDRNLRRERVDGGGSTAMAVNGELVNRPSDAAGERAVGDTIQVLRGTR
ncbi:phosphodiester glycosidase family protein [Streptosporangium sp. NPDC087985]|uniref:phosphodiester glycosidase family protein n=1 Tax=Streptosporangium sp. NPDC087985 TaxID=3366196 RepID=UPI003805CE53